jgi:hypothetical protein
MSSQRRPAWSQTGDSASFDQVPAARSARKVVTRRPTLWRKSAEGTLSRALTSTCLTFPGRREVARIRVQVESFGSVVARCGAAIRRLGAFSSNVILTACTVALNPLEHLGEMESMHTRSTPAQTRLQLAKTAWIDGDHEVNVEARDLLELRLQNLVAVSSAEERVGTGGTAASVRVRQLDEIGDGIEQVARFNPRAEPIAEMAGVLQRDTREAPVYFQPSRADGGTVLPREVLAQFDDPRPPELGSQMSRTPAGRGDDRAGDPRSKSSCHLAASLQISIVGVESAAASLVARHPESRNEGHRRTADLGEENPFEASEHEARASPGTRSRSSAQSTEQTKRPLLTHRERESPHHP